MKIQISGDGIDELVAKCMKLAEKSGVQFPQYRRIVVALLRKYAKGEIALTESELSKD